jgi:hypothetical protein
MSDEQRNRGFKRKTIEQNIHSNIIKWVKTIEDEEKAFVKKEV